MKPKPPFYFLSVRDDVYGASTPDSDGKRYCLRAFKNDPFGTICLSQREPVTPAYRIVWSRTNKRYMLWIENQMVEQNKDWKVLQQSAFDHYARLDEIPF